MQKTKEETHVGVNGFRPLAKNKGITLVALIVTIIVLLILAGVAVSTLTGDKGIIARAKQVAGEYENASGEEANEINEIFNMTNKGENPEPEQPVVDATMQNVRFIYTPSGVTNENVKVKIETTTGYIIQYKIGESDVYTRYTSEIEILNNCTIYARLANSSGVTGNYITGNVQNIDKVAPNDFTPTTGIITANRIQINASTEDTGSAGCAASNIGIKEYRYYVGGELKHTGTETTYTVVGLTKSTNYIIYVIAEDKAGNIRKSNSITVSTTEVITDGSYANGVNTPKLGNEMKPVYWDGDSWEIPTTNEQWYEYKENVENANDSRWANAVTEDGSMWVWIPRYEYKITQTEKERTGTIDIRFIPTSSKKGSAGYTTGTITNARTGVVSNNITTSADGYIIHPAFCDGTSNTYSNGEWKNELSGIWVAKYKMSMESSEDGTTWTSTLTEENMYDETIANVATTNAGNSNYVRVVSKPRSIKLEIYKFGKQL